MITGTATGIHRGRESPGRTDLVLDRSRGRPGRRDILFGDAGKIDDQIDLPRFRSRLLQHSPASMEREAGGAFVARDMDRFDPDVALEIDIGGERFGRYLFVLEDIGYCLPFWRQIIARSDDAHPSAHMVTSLAMTLPPEIPFRAKPPQSTDLFQPSRFLSWKGN